MQNIGIGVELFSVYARCEKEDLPATLREVRSIGYTAVELWDYDGVTLVWKGWKAAELRRLFDDTGLVCCGLHLSTQAMQGDNLKRTIEFSHHLDNRFLIIAGDKNRMATPAGIQELGNILTEAAATLAPHEMWTGYHAHAFDFARLGNGTAWEILFRSLSPDIIMQLDIGNCARGGGDPVAILRQFPGRARSVHVKDFGDAPELAVGEGKANWPEIFDLCETTQHTEWYVVEQAAQNGMDFGPIRRSFQNLRAMGKCPP